MLKIAVVANTYEEAKQFAEYKFKDKTDKINRTTQIYYLKNGDEVHLCYDEQNKDRYLSVVYDAFVIHPQYTSLLDVIRHRCERI